MNSVEECQKGEGLDPEEKDSGEYQVLLRSEYLCVSVAFRNP